ncbi:MAG: hypothetical protein N3D17_01540 [bacterium]|nr:hypothetical protein [bacterium]
MEEKKRKADIIREEKKKQLLNFIEKKKTKIMPSEKTIPPILNSNPESIPPVNKEAIPKEIEKTHMEGSNRRKKRRDKLQEIKEIREEIKKKRALAILEKKQKKDEERKKRKEEIQQKKLEALKKREESRQKEERKKSTSTLTPSVTNSNQTTRKEELLEFIKRRKLLYEQNKGRKEILKQAEEKKEIPGYIKDLETPLPAAITAKISALSREAKQTEKEAQNNLSFASGNIKHFISSSIRKKKETKVEKPAPSINDKKTTVKYKEPFLLIPFIRRNIFKFVFLILLIAWIYEIFFFIERFQDPQKRLSDIVGEDVSKEKTAPISRTEEKIPLTEEEFKFALKKEKIDIEGKRDPFSPGLLTMQVFEKPEITRISLAPKPSVISILRPSKVVSVIKEEKKMEAEKLSSISKPQPPSYKPILKDKESQIQPILRDKGPSQIQPVEKPAESLIMPEKRCDLTYRGRLVIEGVEYLFIEGKNKTYRVTIGDVVEGFRIIRKEKDKLYLSKEGIIYEIPVD